MCKYSAILCWYVIVGSCMSFKYSRSKVVGKMAKGWILYVGHVVYIMCQLECNTTVVK